jgi:predicted ATPase
MSLRELSRLAELERIWVRNFKSLKDFEFSKPTKLLIVAGMNGSGKTALVEAFELLTQILEWARGLNPNPFHKWWGYDKVVWRHNEDLPIIIGLKLRLGNIESRALDTESRHVKALLEEFENLAKDMSITYEISASGKGGRFNILKETLQITAKNLQLSIDTAKSVTSLEIDITKEFNDIVKSMKEFGAESKEETIKPVERGKGEYAELSQSSILKLSIALSDIIDLFKEVFTSKYIKENMAVLELLSNASEIFRLASHSVRVECRLRESRSLLTIVPIIEKDIEVDASFVLYRLESFVENTVFGDECRDHIAKVINNMITIDSASPRYREFVESLKGVDVNVIIERAKNALSRHTAKEVIRRVIRIVVFALLVVHGFIDGIAVVKNIDWKTIASPQPLTRVEKLSSDASNFLQFFFTLTGGVIGDDLKEALRYSFPGYENYSIVFDVTTDGRVFPSLVVDGLKLPPVSIPQGVLKTLMIESLIIWKPTVIVIDEFENSLHPELQQFLLDELRNSDAYVIIATHSTIPLNYAKNINEVVILKLENGETKPYGISREALEILKSKKLTLSELLLSGLVRFEPKRY